MRNRSVSVIIVVLLVITGCANSHPRGTLDNPIPIRQTLVTLYGCYTVTYSQHGKAGV